VTEVSEVASRYQLMLPPEAALQQLTNDVKALMDWLITRSESADSRTEPATAPGGFKHERVAAVPEMLQRSAAP
jgi:hypothetical protein